VVQIQGTPHIKKHPIRGDFLWWGYTCTNRTENKQEFTNLMQQVKELKDKWLISPEGEN
jgi:hypothetical protein